MEIWGYIKGFWLVARIIHFISKVKRTVSEKRISLIGGTIRTHADEAESVIGADITKPVIFQNGTVIETTAGKAKTIIGVKIGGTDE